jgi:parallel beta-helix repeat protein
MRRLALTCRISGGGSIMLRFATLQPSSYRASRWFRPRLARLECRLAPATITVTTVADNTTVDGKVSLREALTSSNNNANLNPDVVASNLPYGADVIVFNPMLFGSAQTITLNTVLPDITGDTTFQGTSASNVIITRGATAFRLFNCNISGVGNVSFSNLTVTGGSASSGFGAGIAAGDDNLTVTNCIISNNVNSGTSGGGAIGVANGGGIITVTNSTMSGNTATCGGGIYFDLNGVLVMTGCTLTGNKATAGNGGAAIYNLSDTATIRNTTISGNTATVGSGGGITLQGASSFTIQNCTIANNSAAGNGGGIVNLAGTLSIESSIVAKNKASIVGDDINGSANFAKFNLIGETDGAFGVTDPSNKTGTKAVPLNPMIGSLNNNGGPTLTHALLAGSPCINTGSNPAGKTSDQRGSPILRVSGGQADIGAFETSLAVASIADAGADTLRQAVSAANFQPGADTITFDPAFFGSAKTVALITGEIAISDAVTIAGPGSALATVSGNNASRVFEFKSGSSNSTVSGLTVTKGNTGSFGGGIYAIGNLTILQCVISGNTGNYAGGVFVYAKLTLIDSQVTNNSATNQIGGVYGNGGTTIQRSIISGNTAQGSIGGLLVTPGFTMTDSTVSYNIAGGNAGGLDIVDSIGATDVIRNCTISGNTAGQSGGGIALGYGAPFNSTLTVQNCTITANKAAAGSGGGITRLIGTGTISVESSIVSGNASPTSPEINSPGTVNVKTSAIGSSLGLSSFVDQGGNLPFGANLKLGTLSSNGGTTQTILPAPDSPLVNAGSNPAALSNDQRGSGFSRTFGGGVDIGAIESRALIVENTNDAGVGSLRQIIIDGNTQSGSDTVTFDSTVFASAKSIRLTTGEIDISDALTINGPAAQVTIDGNANSRIFATAGTAGGVAVVLQDLALTNGKADSGSAIYADLQSVTLRRCTISNCTATNSGGAIYLSSSSLILENCTLAGNTASSNSGAGGAIYFVGDIQTLTSTNSTFSGNSAASDGGAMKLFGGTVAIQNCTLTANTAGGAGGGIARDGNGGALSLTSTIVAGNVSGPAPDLYFYSSGSVGGNNNLIGVADVGNYTLTGTNNQTGTTAKPLDAKLSPLANNGGPTQTHALMPVSPAIDEGSNPSSIPTDQRGNTRVIGTAADIGAYEVQAPAKFSSVVINGGDSQRSMVTKVTVNFNQHIGFTGAAAAAFTLYRLSDSAPVNLAAAVDDSGAGTAVTLTFTGGAVNGVSLADGRYALHILASGFNAEGFDGDGSGVAAGSPTDDYAFDEPASPATLDTAKIFRIYGDVDGDGAVITSDFMVFRQYFNAFLFAFDFDGDGFVSTSDFAQFRNRFNTSI